MLMSGTSISNTAKHLNLQVPTVLRLVGRDFMCEVRVRFPLKKKPIGYWTKEKCLEEGSRYINASDWSKANKGSYQAAVRKKWHLDVKFRMLNN